jgi:hypothetical protein
MKIVFEEGDIAYYEGERCTVFGQPTTVNGVEGIHVKKANGDTVLTPLVILKTFDQWLLSQCIECLNAQEQWDANLTTDEDDTLLESMSTSNFDMLQKLQSFRKDIGRALSMNNKGKN